MSRSDSPDARGRVLHVTNGSRAGRIIEQAALPGTWSVWADPLHDGCVPDGDDRLVVAARARHLAGGSGRIDEIERDLMSWRQQIFDHLDGEVVLWFEHDLFDQLNLVQLLAWLAHAGHGCRISLICIDRFPGHAGFKGLGQLSPTELASLFPSRQPVIEAQYVLAQRVWNAFRQPTPEALGRVCREDLGAFPFLTPALIRFLQEYPWTRDGLSRSERRLLQLARQETTLLAVFPRMHDDERAYYITDTGLVDLAEARARPSQPLLALSAAPERERGGLNRTVTITAAGRSVLDAGADRVDLCGIDRWLGGVKLSAATPLWRWDETAARVIQSPAPRIH